VAVANSLALKLAGITKETPNPSGGKIEPDAVAEPVREKFVVRVMAGVGDHLARSVVRASRVLACARGAQCGMLRFAYNLKRAVPCNK
jgi:predicted amidohydrolase YtcJ